MRWKARVRTLRNTRDDAVLDVEVSDKQSDSTSEGVRPSSFEVSFEVSFDESSDVSFESFLHFVYFGPFDLASTVVEESLLNILSSLYSTSSLQAATSSPLELFGFFFA